MVRLNDISELEREHLLSKELPVYDTTRGSKVRRWPIAESRW